MTAIVAVSAAASRASRSRCSRARSLRRALGSTVRCPSRRARRASGRDLAQPSSARRAHGGDSRGNVDELSPLTLDFDELLEASRKRRRGRAPSTRSWFASTGPTGSRRPRRSGRGSMTRCSRRRSARTERGRSERSRSTGRTTAAPTRPRTAFTSALVVPIVEGGRDDRRRSPRMRPTRARSAPSTCRRFEPCRGGRPGLAQRAGFAAASAGSSTTRDRRPLTGGLRRRARAGGGSRTRDRTAALALILLTVDERHDGDLRVRGRRRRSAFADS